MTRANLDVLRGFTRAIRPAFTGARDPSAPSEIKTVLAVGDDRRIEPGSQENERRLRDLVGTLDLAPVLVRHPDGRIRFWSHGCERLYGWTVAEAEGRVVHELLRTEFLTPRADIEARLVQDGVWCGDLVHRRRDGTEIVVAAQKVLQRDAAGRPTAVMESLADVTALRRAEADLHRLNLELESRVRREVAAREEAQGRAAQAERMQALGQLAGGIAHDFNNVLQAIAGGAALIERRPSDSEAARRYSRMILEAAERGAAITRRLLGFARRGELEAVQIDPAGLLTGLREILTYTLGATIEVRLDLAPGLPALFADKGQLETVLVNLAANARDAMPHGGVLTLAAGAEEVRTPHRVGLAPGSYVRISVTDSGIGMDLALLTRVTEPFFTTKEVGKGTGLGLAMAKGFTEQSGGALAIDSAPGRGTKVTLWIPRATPEDTSAPTRANGSASSAGPARILLVDDEQIVRETLAVQLERLGHAVAVAESGAAALDLPMQPDVLVTDLSMPGMDGLALIRQLQARHPNLPAILLTGHPGDASRPMPRTAQSAPVALMRKPATGEQVARQIAELRGRTLASVA
jgi:PAS domain S-box-containing protein